MSKISNNEVVNVFTHFTLYEYCDCLTVYTHTHTQLTAYTNMHVDYRRSVLLQSMQ